MIKEKKIITFYYDHESKIKEICLNSDERNIKDFREINIDATAVEILPKDDIYKDYFLLPYIDLDYKE